MILISILGCAPEDPIATQQPSEVAEAPTEVAQELTATQTPTIPEATPQVMLLVGQEADPFTISQVQSTLEELVSTGGQNLLIVESISSPEMQDSVELVVSIGSDVDITNLATGSPQIHFIAIDQPGVSPLENLSIIGDPELDQKNQSFMAGYLAALVSTDYKVGALIPADSDQSDRMLDAFIIGTRFFCGICRPLYPPFNTFPHWDFLSIENNSAGFQPVIDVLVSYGVEVIYLQGKLLSPEILTYLSDLGVKVVSDQSPETLRNNWVGTVAADPSPALALLWSDLMAGSSGVRKSSSITLIDTESGLLSEGRRRVFDEMVADLEAGLVYPQSIQ